MQKKAEAIGVSKNYCAVDLPCYCIQPQHNKQNFSELKKLMLDYATDKY